MKWMNPKETWPPQDLGKGRNPYTYGTWQWHEHECAASYRHEAFWNPIKLCLGIAFLVGWTILWWPTLFS